MRRVLTPALLAAACLAHSACDKGVEVSGDLQAPVAVGAKHRFAVIDSCGYSGPGLVVIGHGAFVLPTPPSCLRTSVETIVNVRSSDPSVFVIADQKVDSGAALVEIEAARAGEARFDITIATTDGAEYTTSVVFEARDVETVDLTGECSRGSDELLQVGQTTRYFADLRDSSGSLLAGFGYFPFESELPLVVEEESNRLVAEAPATPGSFVVTSPDDPAFEKRIRSIDVEGVDAFEIVPSLPQIELTEPNLVLSLRASIEGAELCNDGFERRLTTSAPEICAVAFTGTDETADEATSTGSFALVRGLVPGLCTLEASLTGTEHVATIDIAVVEGWTIMPAPPLDGAFVAGFSLEDGTIHLAGGERRVSREKTDLALSTYDGRSWDFTTFSLPDGADGEGTFHSIWGAGETVFAVGDDGRIARRVGAAPWELMDSGTGSALYAVYGASESDVYAVGAEWTAIHYDGVQWSTLTPYDDRPLRAAWIKESGELLVAGDQGAVFLRGSDGYWTSVDRPNIELLDGRSAYQLSYSSIWGSSDDDLYLGSDGALLRWDGAQWSIVFEGRIEDIFGRSRTDIFTVGAVEDVLMGNGVGWTAHTIDPVGTCDTDSVWGRGETEIYLLCRASASAEGNAVYRYR